MNTIRSPHVVQVHPDENLPKDLVFQDALPSGVTISSVDSVVVTLTEGTEVDPLLVPIAGASVNPAQFTDPRSGLTVDANKSVQVNVSGGTKGCDYDVKVVVVLSSGVTHKMAGVFPFEVLG